MNIVPRTKAAALMPPCLRGLEGLPLQSRLLSSAIFAVVGFKSASIVFTAPSKGLVQATALICVCEREREREKSLVDGRFFSEFKCGWSAIYIVRASAYMLCMTNSHHHHFLIHFTQTSLFMQIFYFICIFCFTYYLQKQ